MAKNQRVTPNSGENTASKKIHNQVLQLQELKSTNNLSELRRGSCAQGPSGWLPSHAEYLMSVTLQGLLVLPGS